MLASAVRMRVPNPRREHHADQGGGNEEDRPSDPVRRILSGVTRWRQPPKDP